MDGPFEQWWLPNCDETPFYIKQDCFANYFAYLALLTSANISPFGIAFL